MRVGDFGDELDFGRREKLSALVFECLEAILPLVSMRCRNRRMDLPRQLLEDLQGRHIAKRT